MKTRVVTPVTTAQVVNTNTELWRAVDVDGKAGIRMDIILDAAGAATGTLQIFLQDSTDGGRTWDDVIASNTFAFGGSLVNQRFAVALQIDPTFTQGAALNDKALTAGTTRKGPLGPMVRLIEKVSGVSGSPTGPQYHIGLSIK